MIENLDGQPQGWPSHFITNSGLAQTAAFSILCLCPYLYSLLPFISCFLLLWHNKARHSNSHFHTLLSGRIFVYGELIDH